MKRILRAMFGIGVFATLAQVTLLREMLVVFHGNELSFGAIMACWLLCVGAGAFGARLLRRDSRFRAWTRHLLYLLPIMMAVFLPAQVWFLRGIRQLLGVGVGEYVPFVRMLGAVFLTCLPCCAGIGLFFPLACEWGVKDRRRVDKDVAGTVSRIYTAEAMGSMLGGAVLTFILLPRLTPLHVVAVAGVVGLLTASCVAPGRVLRRVIGTVCVLLVIGVVATDGVAGWEARFVQRRWEGFGVLGHGASGTPTVRLVDSLDTVYQNLAMTESQGQYALYGDGKLMFVFPNEIDDEHEIHPMMGMYPEARRVLVLGGNPVGVIPQLLKYRVEEVVFVELDPGIVELIRRVDPAAVEQALSDPRVSHVIGDGVRYVQRATGPFDLIMVNAPEPATAGANRFYTVEFYESLRRILSRGGIVITGITASVRLQAEAQVAGGAVYQALNRVFPVVKATAETRSRLFAGAESVLPDGSPRITFDRRTLYDRSRSADITTTYFRPEWFLGADEIEAAKTELAERRFREAVVAENRVTRPAACFANLGLWSRFSGSGLERMLDSVKKVRPLIVKAVLLIVGSVFLLIGWLLRPWGGERARGGWVRGLSGVVLASIGFFSLSMEVLLVMVFQGLYGYIYTRMGLIVAAFMLGLVVGAPSGRALCRRGASWSWGGLFVILAILLLGALEVPRMMSLVYRSIGHPILGPAFEVGFYVIVAGLGFLTGAAFPPANMIFTEAGGSLGAASAVTDASDHLGAALGALLIGVVMLPVLGVAAACGLLAALMAAALLALASAAISRQ